MLIAAPFSRSILTGPSTRECGRLVTARTCCPDASVSGSLASKVGASPVSSLPRTRSARVARLPALYRCARPSIWVRSEAAIVSTAKPRRPGLQPVRLEPCRYCAPSLTVVYTSSAPSMPRQDRRQLACDLVQLRRCRGQNLHRDVAAHPADHFLDAHVDRLREAERTVPEISEHLTIAAGAARPCRASFVSSDGFSTRNVSVRSSPIGSRPSSSDPVWIMDSRDVRDPARIAA